MFLRLRSAPVVLAVTLFTMFPSPVGADVASDWNEFLFRMAVRAGTGPLDASRNAAIVQASVFDAVNGIARKYDPVFVEPNAPQGASKRAAAIQAAYAALVRIYPALKPNIDARLSSALAELASHESQASIDKGLQWGQQVADAIWTWRLGDGISNPIPAPPAGTVPGAYRLTGPGNYVGLNFVQMTPWVMTSPSEFRSVLEGPPALGSAEYTRDFNETKTMGHALSTMRSKDQTAFAWWWNMSTAPAIWSGLAVSLIDRKNKDDGDDGDDDRRGGSDSLLEEARVLAQVNLAMADAAIACWDAKYYYLYWRPVTGIQLGDTDGNSGTPADATYAALFPTPLHPSYPSGHSCVSGAAGEVLSQLFGSRTRVEIANDALPGVTRSFRNLRTALEEVKDARIFAGIHWRFDCDDGQALGVTVARNVLERAMQRR